MEEPKPVQVDVSGDHYRRFIRDPSQPAYVPGHRTIVHIPFSGEKHVFQLRPSSYTLNPPHANVSDGELRFVIEYPDDRPADIKAETDELLKKVEQHLGAARKDIEYWNSGLLNAAQMAASTLSRWSRARIRMQGWERNTPPAGSAINGAKSNA